jgi:hypothetical protein
MKNFFRIAFLGVMIACAILFVFLFIKGLITSTNYEYQAKIITEKGSVWADYEILDNSCLKIIKSSGIFTLSEFLYCGKYIIEK